MLNPITILIVEGETVIREMLAIVLNQAGFLAIAAPDVETAQKILADSEPDLVLIDSVLTNANSRNWARNLKKADERKNFSVILLTPAGEKENKAKSLQIKADDYVAKPFSPKELVARVRAVLRRTGKIAISPQINLGDMKMDIDQHRLTIGNKDVAISPTEFRLIHFFMTHPDKVFSRNQLLSQVWGRSAFIDERTVDVHIRRLRKILAEYGKQDLVKTVRGFGYRFSLPA